MLTQTHLAQKLGNRPFRFFESLASTQNEALTWLKNGALQGAVVIADEQTAGRGRMGRTWHTPAGVALALSVILRPTPEGSKHVFMAGAVAVAELLEGLGIPNITLKWANDVRIDGKKVCGVLPEAVWQGDKLGGVVLGMGVNIRVNFGNSDLATTATNIETELDRRVDRADLVAMLLDRVDNWTNRLGSDDLYHAWRSRLDTLGKSVSVDGITGIAHDVTHDGALIIQKADGTFHTVIAGDLS
jgi:BirA family biotin operon repressor/biotin-[acetyl-CoA-carboxylase] ligase